MYSNVSSRKVLSKSPKNPVAFNDKFKKGVFFIPMCIGGGFLYNTDKGLVDFETFDNNEFTWEEIIADGQGDLQIYWDGSIVCETKSEKLNFGEDQVERYTHTELTYKVGNYGFGFATESGFGFEVGSDVSYNDFNTMTHKEEITLLVKPEDLNGVDLTKFRLYCFPELFKKKVFFISDMIVHRDINNQEKIISYEITFSHISNKFQKSGKAVEEYFHFSMIGNGYS